GPHVKVFSGKDGSLLDSFFAYASSFTGGVTVAGGDVNGDGFGDIITGAASGGAPHVKAFSGTNLQVLASFYAFDPNTVSGVYVAAGDLNNDGKAEIVAGVASGTPIVSTFDGATGAQISSFLAYTPVVPTGLLSLLGEGGLLPSNSGVRVAVVKQADGKA